MYFILVVLAVIFPFLISSLPISCLCIKYGDRKNHIYRAVVPEAIINLDIREEPYRLIAELEAGPKEGSYWDKWELPAKNMPMFWVNFPSMWPTDYVQ